VFEPVIRKTDHLSFEEKIIYTIENFEDVMIEFAKKKEEEKEKKEATIELEKMRELAKFHPPLTKKEKQEYYEMEDYYMSIIESEPQYDYKDLFDNSIIIGYGINLFYETIKSCIEKVTKI